MVSIQVEVCLMLNSIYAKPRLYWNERLKQWCHCQEEHYGPSTTALQVLPCWVR